MKTVFIVAGEASADMYASAVLAELRKESPSLSAFGVGGEGLAAQGMERIVDASQLSIVGTVDWLDKFTVAYRSYKKVVTSIRTRKPDCALLLDLPDFNLLLVKKLKKLGIPVFYYISPQVWAWRKYRVNKIRKYVDKMLVVFPFEKDFYEKRGVSVEFVGHPLLDAVSARDRVRVASEWGDKPRIAILPGSRHSEIRFHAKVIRELGERLRAKYPLAEIRIPVANTLELNWVKENLGSHFEYSRGNSHDTLRWADSAVVASGTATLETALTGTPFCLFYQVSNVSAWIYKNLIRWGNFIGMPNLLHGREVVKEFFQEKATGSALFEEVVQILESEPYRLEMVKKLSECRTMLGSTGANRRVAAQVYSALNLPSDGSLLVPSPSLS